MILIDGGNLCYRTFQSAIKDSLETAKKEFPERKIFTKEELREVNIKFNHYLLNDILNYKKSYLDRYGKFVMCFDGRNYWRKRHYSEYKSNRKKKRSDWDKHTMSLYNNLKGVLEKVLEKANISVINGNDIKLTDGYQVEADDIIAILVKEKVGPHLIISSDGDFKQLSSKDVRQYHLIHRKLIDIASKKDIQLWKDTNVLSGQSKDGIPSILDHCKLSDDFIDWLKEEKNLEIDHSFIEKIEKNHQNLMEEYEEAKSIEDEKLISEGTRKTRRNLSAYHKPKFGPVKALKWLADFDNNIKLNTRYKTNYDRNKKLLLFDEIDEDVKDSILKYYGNLDNNEFLNTIELMNILSKIGLYKIQERIDEF